MHSQQQERLGEVLPTWIAMCSVRTTLLCKVSPTDLKRRLTAKGGTKMPHPDENAYRAVELQDFD